MSNKEVSLKAMTIKVNRKFCLKYGFDDQCRQYIESSVAAFCEKKLLVTVKDFD